MRSNAGIPTAHAGSLFHLDITCSRRENTPVVCCQNHNFLNSFISCDMLQIRFLLKKRSPVNRSPDLLFASTVETIKLYGDKYRDTGLTGKLFLPLIEKFHRPNLSGNELYKHCIIINCSKLKFKTD